METRGQINLKYWYLLGEMLWYVWHWISPLLQTCHLLKSNTTGGTSGMRTANPSWFVVEIAVLGRLCKSLFALLSFCFLLEKEKRQHWYPYHTNTWPVTFYGLVHTLWEKVPGINYFHGHKPSLFSEYLI